MNRTTTKNNNQTTKLNKDWETKKKLWTLKKESEKKSGSLEKECLFGIINTTVFQKKNIYI